MASDKSFTVSDLRPVAKRGSQKAQDARTVAFLATEKNGGSIITDEKWVSSAAYLSHKYGLQLRMRTVPGETGKVHFWLEPKTDSATDMACLGMDAK